MPAPNSFDLQALFTRLDNTQKFRWRLQRLLERPGFSRPGQPQEVACMQVCNVLVLLDEDPILAAEALHFSRAIVSWAVSTASGSTFDEKLKDRSIRPILEQRALLTADLLKRDFELARKEQ